MTPDVNVVMLDLPTREKEAVTENEDGSFTIVINARLSHNQQLLSYNHAMKHIQDNDFQKADVQAIEAAAHSARTPEIQKKESKRARFKKCPDWLKAVRARNRKLHKELDRYVGSYGASDDWDLSSSQRWYGGSF